MKQQRNAQPMKPKAGSQNISMKSKDIRRKK